MIAIANTARSIAAARCKIAVNHSIEKPTESNL